MKKLLAFALTAGLTISLFAADIFKYVPVTGKVKAYTETEFSIASRFGTLYRTPSSKVLHTFDSNGKETTSSELTPKDAVINKIANLQLEVFDKNEHKEMSLEEFRAAEGKNPPRLYGSGMLVLNTPWKLEEETFAVIEYLKNGLKIDSSEFDRKGTLCARTIYTYENNLLTDESSYDGEGALFWKIIYKYDDRNRTASVNEYNPYGTLSEQIVYNYTDSGAIDSIAKRDAFTEKQTSMVFRYGTNGVLNEITTYNSDKQVIKRTLLKYDDKGNVNKVSEYDVAEKFGTTVNDLVAMSEFSFDYSGSSADAK